MNRDELLSEIQRVETALKKTTSRKLRSDYGKYLKRLYKDLRYYDRSMERWQKQPSRPVPMQNMTE